MILNRLYLGIFLLVMLFGSVASVLAQDSASQSSNINNLLAVDTSIPLNIKVINVEQQDGVAVEDITFKSVTGDQPIQAYVVKPSKSKGPFAGVLFVHWYAPTFPTSNRSQFLNEAKALAHRGTVSLLVSTFWSD
ncbi:MAG: hypothetical protein AB1489_37110, partial [Acidobacteriota bacterium]